MMKKCFLLAAVLLLGLQASAGGFWDDWFKKEKTSHHSIGLSLMGKTMKCDGVSMSYIVSELGTMALAGGLDFGYEKMIKKTPLGVLTGVRAEFSKPYYSYYEGTELVKRSATDLVVGVPLMLQYHDKVGDHTELQLFAGPCVDLVVFRAVGDLSNENIYLFGGAAGSIAAPNWRGVDVSFQYGIGIRHKDISFKISNGLGLMNHFKKDYTAQNLGYPVYIQRPIMGTVLFNW